MLQGESKIALIRVTTTNGKRKQNAVFGRLRPNFLIIGNSLVKGFGGCSSAGLA